MSKEYSTWKIEYDSRAVKELKKLPQNEGRRIVEKIEKYLKKNPYIGEHLKGKQDRFYRYRVGDYWVIYAIENNRLTILDIRIGDRKEVYRLPL